MIRARLPLALGLLSLAGGVTAAAPARITMAEELPVDRDVAGQVGLMAPRGTIRQITAQCDLPHDIARLIAEELRRKRFTVEQVANPDEAQGPVLHIVIEGMQGFTGAFKGPKILTLRGELRDGATLLGSFVARERVGKLFSNSCEEFIATGEKAARDIAKWMKSPKPKARLGKA